VSSPQDSKANLCGLCLLLPSMTATPEKKLVDLVSGEILSSDRLGNFMAVGGGLGGGNVSSLIFADPSSMFDRLWWDHAMAMYVYRDIIEKDDKISSDLDTRMEAVLAKPRIMKPASEKRQDKKLADFMHETLEGYMGGGDGTRFGFHNFLWEALDAIGKGVAIGEIIYQTSADRVFVEQVKFKPQMLFSFAEGPLAQYQNFALPQTGPLRLRQDLSFAIEGIDPDLPLPRSKFFVHTFRPYQGDRWGSPLVRRLFWLAYFKKAGLKAWLRYNERGSGTVLAKYNTGGSDDEKRKALQLAQAVSEEAAAAASKGTELEVLENVRASLGSSHNELVDRCDNAIARVVLGQTLTSRGSEGGGSRSLGEVHERVGERKTEVDANSLMAAVNLNIVFPLTFLKEGPIDRPPIWTVQTEPNADTDAVTNRLYKVWRMGVPIGKKSVYVMTEVPQPAEGEELLPLPSRADETSPVPGGESGAVFGEHADGDPLKKKSAHRLLRQPTSNRERFAKWRPSTIEFSRD
jgi:phage gp29-like protein